MINMVSFSVKEQCLVLFPYTAQNEDELSLEEGQLITIITRYLISNVADPDPGSGIGCLFDPWIRDPG
jgi:hypothetical protein